MKQSKDTLGFTFLEVSSDCNRGKQWKGVTTGDRETIALKQISDLNWDGAKNTEK